MRKNERPLPNLSGEPDLKIASLRDDLLRRTSFKIPPSDREDIVYETIVAALAWLAKGKPDVSPPRPDLLVGQVYTIHKRKCCDY